LLLLFLFPSVFAFGVALGFADQGSLSNRWVETSSTSHVFDPAARNHD
jgi:hypothetical protein